MRAPVAGLMRRVHLQGMHSNREYAELFAQSKWRQSRWAPSRIRRVRGTCVWHLCHLLNLFRLQNGAAATPKCSMLTALDHLLAQCFGLLGPKLSCFSSCCTAAPPHFRCGIMCAILLHVHRS